jgi:hypothetical protein
MQQEEVGTVMHNAVLSFYILNSIHDFNSDGT